MNCAARIARLPLLFVFTFAFASPRAARCAEEIYLSDDAYFLIWVIDPETGMAVRGIRAPDQVMGAALPPGRSGLAFDGAELFYTLSSSRLIFVLDPRTGAVRRSFAKPSLGISGLGSAGGDLFAIASSGRNGTVYRLSPSTGEIVGHLELPGAREALDASTRRGSIFARVGGFELGEWSIADGSTLHSFTPPAQFMGLAFSDARNELLGVTASGMVFRIEPNGGRVLGSTQGKDSARNELFETGGMAANNSVNAPFRPAGGGLGDPGRIAPGVALPQTELDAQDLSFHAGDRADVPILLSSTGETEGFQTAIVHDPSILRLEAIVTEDTATAEHDADFTSVDLFPNGGTLAVIFDLSPPHENNTLPPGQNIVIAKYRYSCVQSDIQSPLTTEIRFLDSIVGDPVKDNLVVFHGVALTPELFPGQIVCLPRVQAPGGPEFFCGGPPRPDGSFTDLSARSGERVKLCFYYEFEQPGGNLIQGLSMALAYDCRLDCLQETFEVPPGSITAQIGADFVDFQCENDPDDGDGCEMILGILADSVPPFGNESLPPTIGSPLLLACVQLEVGGGVETDECLDVRFRDGLNGRGKVPIKNLVALESSSIPAKTHPCAVCVTTTGPSFFCGGGELDDAGRPTIPVGQPGDQVEMCLWYSSPDEPVLALTQALRHDCHLQCLASSFRIAPDVPELRAAELVLFDCENDPLDGDPCEMALRIIARSDGGNGTALPPANQPRKLGCVTMKIATDAPRGHCLDLMYHDRVTVGGVESHNEVRLFSGTVAPNTFDCKVCVVPAEPPKFLCGGPTLGPDGLPTPIREVARGDRAELCFWYTSPVDELTNADEIQGLSMALCYDCNLKCIEDSFRVPPDSVLAEIEVEFLSFQCDNDPNDGDGCEMVLGLLVDYLPPIQGRTLPPSNVPLKLACVDMEVRNSAKPGFCLPIQFCDGANGRGKVPIKNLVSVNSTSVQPSKCNCAICVKHLGPKFFCGSGKLGRDGLPETTEGKAGVPAEVCFWYCSPEDGSGTEQQFDHIQGVSMALTFDCRLRCIEDSLRIPPDSITAALGAEYVSFQCDNDPNDGDGCEMILAILIDAAPPFDGRTLPPTAVPLKLACVDLAPPLDPTCGECFDIRFTDGINGRGKVPIFNQVAVENMSFLAITFDCKICVTEIGEPVFHRGDCNFSNMGIMSVDIADAAEVVSFLFGKGTWKPQPPCLDACDANDDGRIDLADAFAILAFLFRFGPVPPPPGPFLLGPDPTPDKIGCDVHPCP